ncbi:putative altered inheritance of mitochondria protein 18, mitochondrial [Hyaloscypha hepaticicola]|uniref:Putative altered inheritance of mitochondria protein 18, mitochondrial n=1 Tax=Hyaloscypha hepaticicola TaxID=2082293 RepID=A0A2J6Q263_9HELO|nr:putative altered inheritance of mitochondria protein 18, mitochondrial [Hyaloscypha hepaticicola]
MSLLNPSTRILRGLGPQLRSTKCLRTTQRLTRPSSRSLTSKPPTTQEPRKSLDPITLHRLEVERLAYYKRRSYYAAAGFVFGMIAIYITATSVPLDPPQNTTSSSSITSTSNPIIKPTKLDSGRRPDDPLVVLGRERKVVVQKLGEEPEEKVDVVETGTSTVPTFPRILDFYDDEREAVGNGLGPGVVDDRLVEYQLVGLGIRTVSFLGIQVYVVGMYVATDDIAALQQGLIRKIDPVASTLVAGEKENLKGRLYDPEEGTRIWSSILRESGVRTLLRIVPTRNTDFHHLRDGWVRSITAKAVADKEQYGDEAFGAAVQEFKALFNRGSVPKQKELLLSRDKKGKLAVWYDDGKNGAQRLGDVADERISRAVWLNYLAGKTVASEGARKSIVEGVMEFVERPVGTVATQVV